MSRISDEERLLTRLGAVQIEARRHKVFLLNGQRFTLHRGGKQNPRQRVTVESKLRRMGLLR